jgi:hypothetical protein
MKYVKPELVKYDELKQVTFSHVPEHHATLFPTSGQQG